MPKTAKDKEEIIDEVLVSVMLSPKTFTTEDIVEINCHGGIATTKRILELLIENGGRLAEPGEFTKRAFLNGRISLLEAESVSDLIESKSESQRRMAISGVNGRLTAIIKKIREDILNIIANIEVNIDYPEYEDALEITHEYLKEKGKMIASIYASDNNIDKCELISKRLLSDNFNLDNMKSLEEVKNNCYRLIVEGLEDGIKNVFEEEIIL